MPLAGNRSAGNYCAVTQCSSAQGKMKLWGEQLCEIHGVTKKTCCPAPYHLHRFPINKDLRDQWIQWINRENFEPKGGSRVCSLHFIDGKPSVEHPIPSIALGSLRYKKKMSATGESIGMEVNVKTEFGTNDYVNLDPEGVEEPQIFSGETVTEMKEDSFSPPPFQHITVSSLPQFYMRVESPVDLSHFFIPEDMMEEALCYVHDYDDPLQGQGNEDRDPLRHSTLETSIKEEKDDGRECEDQHPQLSTQKQRDDGCPTKSHLSTKKFGIKSVGESETLISLRRNPKRIYTKYSTSRVVKTPKVKPE